MSDVPQRNVGYYDARELPSGGGESGYSGWARRWLV